MAKIVDFDPPTKEGIGLEFDEPISILSEFEGTKWWLSWSSISGLINDGIEFRKMKGKQDEQDNR
jgi:hypothetical protein